MVPRVVVFVLAGVLIAQADIDLTPRPSEWELEGVRVHEIAFANGHKTITYTAPAGWRVSGGGLKFRMVPPDVTQAEGTIEVRKKPTATAFDGEAIKRLKEEVVDSLPRDATVEEWESDEANPLMMNGHETYRITLLYSAYGKRIRTSVVTCNFAEHQLQFGLSTRDTDFKKLYEEFRRSLYTWQGLE